MNDAAFMIAVTEAKLDAEKEITLENRLKTAMRTTRNHWMCTDEDARFKAAVGGVMLLSDEPTRERLSQEIQALNTLGAACAGIPVNFDALPEPDFKPIGLLKLWKEVLDEK